MLERKGHEVVTQGDQEIILPGLLRRMQLNHAGRIALDIRQGSLSGANETKKAISVSNRYGQSIEVWDDSDPLMSLHTTVEIGYDEMGVLPPFIGASRVTTYRGRGHEWDVPTFFSSAVGSDNSLSLRDINSTLRLARSLEPVLAPEAQPVLR